MTQAQVSPEYELQLSPAEVAPGGVFDALHCWLDAAYGGGAVARFLPALCRQIRGGVAPERWHLSYAPLAV